MAKRPVRNRQGKIVATLGPGTRSPKVVRMLAEAGVDVFRLNFSHGSHDDHRASLDSVRAAESATGRPLAVMADLQGPKVRIGTFEDGPLSFRFNAEMDLVAAESTGAPNTIPVPHGEILTALEVGDEILCNDGMVALEVISCGDSLKVRSALPGQLSDKKGFTVRGKALPVRALTEKDEVDLAFAMEIGVDIVALSFVQSAEDIAIAKAQITNQAPLIAKLEKPAAIDNLEAIIEAADGVMVARGDLGVEFPAEQVPIIQRRIIRAARAMGRPVIVATQMLESMIDNAAPTRAEAGDVATAIYQGADAVMLSAETAVGRHPATAVAVMGRIISATEQAEDFSRSLSQFDGDTAPEGPVDIIARSAFDLARMEGANALALRTGALKRLARFARARGAVPILYGSKDERRLRCAQLLWGTHPVSLDDPDDSAWVRKLMEKTGLDGVAAWSAWRGDDETRIPVWELGVEGE
ncbi:MAG: pyruvate kinase [Pseudomonadota bacterium]